MDGCFLFVKINDHFLRFGYVYQVVVLTQANQSLNFLSIHRLISIVDTANYSGVIRELNHANRLVTRYTVVCKEGEKERRKHAALWGTSVKNNRFGERVDDLDRLRPVKKKVESPVTDGRMHIQRYKFVKQLHRNYGVKASPRKESSHKYLVVPGAS